MKYQLVGSGVVLSAVSFALVLYTASEEPFFAFRWFDLVWIVGLGTLVCVLFAIWALACVRAHRRTPRRGPLTTVLVCACVLWSATNLFYLGTSIYGYVQDLRDPQFGPWH